MVNEDLKDRARLIIQGTVIGLIAWVLFSGPVPVIGLFALSLLWAMEYSYTTLVHGHEGYRDKNITYYISVVSVLIASILALYFIYDISFGALIPFCFFGFALGQMLWSKELIMKNEDEQVIKLEDLIIDIDIPQCLRVTGDNAIFRATSRGEVWAFVPKEDFGPDAEPGDIVINIAPHAAMARFLLQSGTFSALEKGFAEAAKRLSIISGRHKENDE